MNPLRKKAAVNKYSPLLSEQSIEEVTELIKADDKGYTEDEVAEIAAALIATPEEKAPKKSASKGKAKTDETEEGVYYEEWLCNVSGKEAKKLEVKRPKVKITEDEAIILNRGVLTGGNTYANMYFAPDSDTPVGE
jgi:hypothetical protein